MSGSIGDNVFRASGVIAAAAAGATGAVNWDTTPKTSSPLAAETTNGYFVNTTSGAITANLPAGSAGDIVAFSDYANTWDSNALTLSPNGSDPINGTNEDVNLTTAGLSVTLVYVDGTRGWKNIDDATTNVTGTPNYISAAGGTPSTGAECGDYKIHTFTGTGPFNVTAGGTPCGSVKLDYLVVAAGGGGSSGTPCDGGQGAAGAGGFRESVPSPAAWTGSPLAASAGALTAAVTDYTITVGGGGAATPTPGPGGCPCRWGCRGGASSFSTITSAGGGGGGAPACSGRPVAFLAGLDGGSGGGIGYGGYGSPVGTFKGAGNEPPVSPAQGTPGGGGIYPSPTSGPSYSGGGGGGALVAGANAPTVGGAAGGAGAGSEFNPSPTYGTPGACGPFRYFAGGGGAGSNAPAPGTRGPGGAGGGGCGGKGTPLPGTPGTVNTGGGGAGGGTPGVTGGAGGPGIVMVKYKFQN